MDRSDYLDVLRRESDAFAAAVADAPLGDPVPCCPDWNVADLVYHLGEVHASWRQIAAEGILDPATMSEVPRLADPFLVEWYRAGAPVLLDTLTRADPSTPVWTWCSGDDVAWVIRRMAHETAVHRWDAQRALGAAVPIEPAVAADGIDELIEHFLPEGDLSDPGETVRFEAIDTGDVFSVTVGNDALRRTPAAEPDVIARGDASDLLLALWRRVPVTVLDVRGDATVLDRFLARGDLD
ncbi:MAG: maleylpyruvate isomerase family mycothiol-dependent enzyme [Actinomycetota bacterium]